MQLLTAWDLLRDAVVAAGSDRMAIAFACQSWYLRNRSRLGALAEKYGLDRLAAYDLRLYIPVSAAVDASEQWAVRALLKGPSEGRFGPEQATRKLRDLFELVTAGKSESPCIRCGSAPLLAMADKLGFLFWECPACGCAQYGGVHVGVDLTRPSRYATSVEAKGMTSD